MKASSARAVVSLMQAFWPSPIVDDATVAAWAGLLEDQRFDLEDASNAMRLLAENNRFRPAISEVITFAHEIWRDRMKDEALALPAAKSLPKGPTFGQYLHDNPDMAERVKALDEKKPGSPTNPIRDALASLLREGL
jgi:hypothetical protein